MDDFLDSLYPEITLETDDILMNLTIKKITLKSRIWIKEKRNLSMI